MCRFPTNDAQDFPGIQIYYQGIAAPARQPLLQGQQLPVCSDFKVLFAPVLPSLNHLAWLFEEEAFAMGKLIALDRDEEVEARLEQFAWEDDSYLVTDRQLIADLAAIVSDDWNRIWGLRQPVAEFSSAGFDDAAFRDQLEFVFDNYDGAYWALYSRNSSLLDEAESHVRSLAASIAYLRIEQASFMQRGQQHDREWQEYQAKLKGGGSAADPERS